MAGRLSLCPKTVCLCVGFNVLHPYLMDLDMLCYSLDLDLDMLFSAMLCFEFGPVLLCSEFGPVDVGLRHLP